MTDALSPTVPAGWYPDPWGSTSQRWWDGTSWSGNLYPQPEEHPKNQTDAPVPVMAPPRESSAAPEEEYVPVAARSTFEPASSYRDAAAPTVGSPYPSRRALRQLATAAHDEHPAATEDPPMESQKRETLVENALPAFTQVPEFSPEPVSALPPPVWQDPDQQAEPIEASEAEPVTDASQAPVQTPAAVEPLLPVPETAKPGTDPASTASSASDAAPAGQPVVASPDAAPAAGEDDWAASLARWDDVEPTSTPPDTLPIFGDSPPVSYSQRAMRYQPLHGRTSPVWLIVFMPVLQALSMFGSIYLFPGLLEFDVALFALAPTEAAAIGLLLILRDWMLFALLPLSVTFFVFTFIMGFQDRARLRLLGHEQTASPWWIVLSPLVYLIVRSVRVRQCTGRRGSGPLTTYICLYIAPPIALIVARAVTSALYEAIPA